jgi:hypothetical protein
MLQEELTLLQTRGFELCHAIIGLLRQNIYQRGCGLPPSIILKWLGNSLCFERRCPLLWSRCSGALPAILLCSDGGRAGY